MVLLQNPIHFSIYFSFRSASYTVMFRHMTVKLFALCQGCFIIDYFARLFVYKGVAGKPSGFLCIVDAYLIRWTDWSL